MTVRASPLASTVLDSMQRVPAILLDSHTAAVAGLLAALSWMVGAPNLRLLGVVTAAMLLDLATGSSVAAYRSVRANLDPSYVLAPGEGWDPHKLYGGILGKVVRLLAIATASCGDWLFLVAPFGGHPDPTAYNYPISAFVLWALAVAELVSAIKTLGAAGVIPSAAAAIIIERLQSKSPDIQLPSPATPPTPAPTVPSERTDP